jgi:hypothetical protein
VRLATSVRTGSPLGRFAFADASGQEIIAIEDRGSGVFAIVGVRTQNIVRLTAPVRGTQGFARVKYAGNTGVCHDKGGAEVTRRLIVAAHNRGMAVAVTTGDYLFVTLNIA